MNGTVLVTGATGNTGRPLVELLRQRGVPVRVMMRSAADRAPRTLAEFARDHAESFR